MQDESSRITDLEERKRLHSGTYVETFERSPISRIERLIPLLNLRGDEALADFACGNAMLLQIIHARVSSYHGIDFSADFISAARRRATAHGINNCSFHCQDIVEFCAQHPAAFDVATAFDFSEHVDDAEFVATFSAIRTTLKPGGRLLLHTPNLDFFIERLKDCGVLRQFPEHIAVRTAETNRALLRRCGFTDDRIRIEELAHYNILGVLHPLRRLPGIGRFFAARLVIECVS